MAGTGRPTDTEVPSSDRQTYLIGRLRTRQITIEEATELFEMMSRTIGQLSRAARARPTHVPSPRAEARIEAGALLGNPDLLPYGLLMLGAGAGLATAIVARARDGPRPRPSSPSRSTPPVRDES